MAGAGKGLPAGHAGVPLAALLPSWQNGRQSCPQIFQQGRCQMRHKNVLVDLIDIPEVRVTAVYDDELQAQLASSINAVGQLQPIVVVQKVDRYELVDGLHRLQEAQRKGDKTIPAVVYEGDSSDALVLNLVTNRLRGKTKASEMVLVIGELTQVHQMDSDQIAERTGLTRDYIERLWRISESYPEVREALDQEVIGVGAAFQIARLPVRAQQEELLRVQTVYNLTVKDLTVQVDQVLAAMQEPAPVVTEQAREPAAPPACEACHGTPPPNMLTAVVLCPNCFGTVYRTHQEAVLTESRNGTDDESGGGA